MATFNPGVPTTAPGPGSIPIIDNATGNYGGWTTPDRTDLTATVLMNPGQSSGGINLFSDGKGNYYNDNQGTQAFDVQSRLAQGYKLADNYNFEAANRVTFGTNPDGSVKQDGGTTVSGTQGLTDQEAYRASLTGTTSQPGYQLTAQDLENQKRMTGADLSTINKAPLFSVPFAASMTDAQKKSINNLITNRYADGTKLNTTDAMNYAFATGEKDWTKFFGKTPAELGISVAEQNPTKPKTEASGSYSAADLGSSKNLPDSSAASKAEASAQSKAQVDSHVASIDQILADYDKKVAADPANVKKSELLARYEAELTKTEGKNKRMAEELKNETIVEADKQIKDIKMQMAQVRAGIAAFANQAIPTPFIVGQQREQTVTYSNLATVLLALTESKTAAEAQAKRTVDLEFGDAEADLARTQSLIDVYDKAGVFSEADAKQKALLTQSLNERTQMIADAKDEKGKVFDFVTKLVEKGIIDSKTLLSVSGASTYEEALKLAAPALMTQATGMTEQQQTAAFKLIDDYEKQSGDLNKTIDNYNKILSSTDGTPQSDMSLIFSYMKMLDPTSVVREGEYANAQNTVGVSQQIINAYNKAVTGVGLDATQRAGFVKQAKNIYDVSIAQQETINKDFTERAAKFGVKADVVIRDRRAVGEEAETPKTINDYVKLNPTELPKVEAMLKEHTEEEVKLILGLSFNQPLSMGQNGLPDVKKVVEAIGKYESGNNYNAIGKTTASGDKAYGKYQVMGNNIPSWTKQVLGYSLTPQQFLLDKAAQDKVAEAKLGAYLKQYGTVEDAASLWFSGRPMAVAGNASDINGTTVPAYIKNILSYYNA